MDLISWLTQISESAQVAPIRSSVIAFCYLIVYFSIRRSVFLLAFLIECLLFISPLTDFLREHQLNLISIVMYSYVFSFCETKKSKIGCVIIILTTIIFTYDAFFYGEFGYYGEAETVVYNNIENIALCVHLIFIWSLVDHKRILNSLRSFFSSISRIALNSDYMLVLCYNKYN